MKTKKLIITVAALIAAITVLSAAVLAIMLPTLRSDPQDTPTPEISDTAAPEPVSDETTAAPAEKNSKSETPQKAASTQRSESTAPSPELAKLTRDSSDPNQTFDPICKRCGCEYTAWWYYNETFHIRICPSCCHQDCVRHTITPASCSEFERCSVCRNRDPSWTEAYGHDLQYVFDADALSSGNVVDPAAYFHEYRCCRRNEDGQLIGCDFVLSRESCTFVETKKMTASGEQICYTCSKCGISFEVSTDGEPDK